MVTHKNKHHLRFELANVELGSNDVLELVVDVSKGQVITLLPLHQSLCGGNEDGIGI